MNIEADKVYTFKLNSGEELVAKVLAVNVDTIDVEHPVSVAPGPQGMGLMPSLFTADPAKRIVLNNSSVAIIGETDDAVRDKYIEATTGIKLPSKKLILG